MSSTEVRTEIADATEARRRCAAFIRVLVSEVAGCHPSEIDVRIETGSTEPLYIIAFPFVGHGKPATIEAGVYYALRTDEWARNLRILVRAMEAA